MYIKHGVFCSPPPWHVLACFKHLQTPNKSHSCHSLPLSAFHPFRTAPAPTFSWPPQGTAALRFEGLQTLLQRSGCNDARRFWTTATCQAPRCHSCCMSSRYTWFGQETEWLMYLYNQTCMSEIQMCSVFICIMYTFTRVINNKEFQTKKSNNDNEKSSHSNERASMLIYELICLHTYDGTLGVRRV